MAKKMLGCLGTGVLLGYDPRVEKSGNVELVTIPTKRKKRAVTNRRKPKAKPKAELKEATNGTDGSGNGPSDPADSSGL